jgi:hypothetical protein
VTRDGRISAPKSLPVPVSPGSALAVAVAEALPRCLEIVLEGCRVRANIETVVRAVETGHQLRLQAVDELERMLRRYGAIMSQELRDEYLLGILRLLDSGHYLMPWDRLLRR